MRLIQLCDTFHLPLVSFADEPGFMVGLESEKQGIERAGTRLVCVTCDSQMPWLTIVMRRLYGVAGQCQHRPTGMFRRFAWPSARWGSMHIEGGAMAAYRREIETAPDPKAKREEIEARPQAIASPFRTAEATGQDIIDPRETRAAICEFAADAQRVIRSQLGPTAPPCRPCAEMRTRTGIWVLSAALGATGASWGQEPESQRPREARVVRAYFDDPLVAARAVISLEALESEYEKGYIVLLATDEDIEAARQAGMRVVEDDDYVFVALPSELPTAVAQGTIAGFPCYRTVEETFAGARTIVSQHPTLATWTTVGKSWKKVQNASDGYDLNVLRLTNSATSGTKPALFITTAVHAREYTTAELGLRFAEYLVDSYETDADVRWLLDHQEVHIMLHANPDGRKRAEEGVLWRKNHNTNHCPDTWPGIDLNRNFDFKWGEAGASTTECSFTYRGPTVASEPETQAIQTYMANLFPDARGTDDDDAASADTSGVYLDIHSHSRLILWPWGHVDEAAPNGTALQTLGRKLAFFNSYTTAFSDAPPSP